MTMQSFYSCSFRRYLGELREDVEVDVYALTRAEAALNLVAKLLDSDARTLDEATTEAQVFVTHELGLGWSVEDLLRSDLEIWSDSTTCYIIHDILVKTDA